MDGITFIAVVMDVVAGYGHFLLSFSRYSQSSETGFLFFPSKKAIYLIQQHGSNECSLSPHA
jgi:hypothetical protein